MAPVDLRDAEPGLLAWLAQGHHGDMAYMARHGLIRARPAELVPGTLSVITARMDYLPNDGVSGTSGWVDHEIQRLQQPTQAVAVQAPVKPAIQRPSRQHLTPSKSW